MDFRNIRKFLFYFSGFIFLLSSLLSAQTISKEAGTVSALFLTAETSPRAASLAGAFTAIANDESAFFYNPAGLIRQKTATIAFNHTQWFRGIRMDNLVAGYKFSPDIGLALSIAHLWMDAIPITDHTGQSDGEMNISNSSVTAALAYRFYRGMYAGLAVNYLNENLHVLSSNRISFDLSYYMFTLVRGLTFGVNLKNMGAAAVYQKEEEVLPFTVRAGLAYKLKNPELFFALDYIKTKGSDFQIALGIEYVFRKQVSLRVGNRFKNGEAFSPAFGIGYTYLNKFGLDYHFEPHPYLDSIHQVGLKYKFDLPYAKKTITQQKRKAKPK